MGSVDERVAVKDVRPPTLTVVPDLDAFNGFT
jgi:hypothetical protein